MNEYPFSVYNFFILRLLIVVSLLVCLFACLYVCGSG